MGHDHGHRPGAGSRGRLALAFALGASVVLVQAVGALVTGSLALLTDTVHALTDSIGLLVALLAATLALRPPDPRRTWGFVRVEVLAALVQAVLLCGVGLYAAVEGVQRLVAPPEVAGGQLALFGLLGLAANVAAILVLAGGRGTTLTMRAAFLEVVADALGSLGVVVAAVVVVTTGYMRADAIAALLIAALVVPRALRILWESTRILLEFTPTGIDLEEVRAHLLRLDHVLAVHDLHASTVATGLPTMSAHVVVEEECFHDGHAPAVLEQVQRCVAEHFPLSIEHSTFQLESAARRDAPTACHPLHT